MRTLVMWADPNSPNLGVQALAKGAANVLSISSETVNFASHRTPLESGPLSIRAMAKALIMPYSRMRREIRSYDLIVDVGEGDSFASIYGRKRLLQFSLSKVLVRRSRTRLVIAPQTVGPFTNRLDRAIAATALRMARSVWVRDSASLRRVQELGQRAVLSTDLVFALPASSGSRIPDGPRRVLLNVSGLLWNPNSHVDHIAYRRKTLAFIESALECRWEVSLLPHVHAPQSPDDDVNVAGYLAREFPGVTVEAGDTLTAAREAIASADLVVGARMHACLNALSLQVPVLPLAYSDKFRALFADLGYPYVHDLRESDTEMLEVPTPSRMALMSASATEARTLADGLIRRLSDTLVRVL